MVYILIVLQPRYVGCMVADIHRTLLYGGLFMYPADSNNKSGKLRLIYECNPLSMIIEQAGGTTTNGSVNILDIVPTTLHQRCPYFAGSLSDVCTIIQLNKRSKL